MGLFNRNTKKLLEKAEIKINSMTQQLENNLQNFNKLKAQIEIIENKNKNLEFDKRELKIQLKEYENLLLDDLHKIKNSKEILNELNLLINDSKITLNNITNDINIRKKELNKISKEYIVMDEAVLLQSFGLYTPKYNFANSTLYKESLIEIRKKQSEMIKLGKAAICLKIWSIEGSAIKGKKLTEDNIKQIIRTFNIECDNIIQGVKFNNYKESKKRILKSFESLNKLNKLNKIIIQDNYLDLKYKELDLAFEYSQKIQEEKEEMKEKREIRKEEIRLAKELEEKRLEVEKEQQHYKNAMERICTQITNETNKDRIYLLNIKKIEIEKGLEDVEIALKDLDYRQANQRAGYVYVISNIGAFGENIYKIGMTRRIDPQDRVDELGDASVPFKFDVHAMIFSEDAPKLETALHKAFENKKINAVNGRKEFFKVTLEEIENIVKINHDKTVDFIKYPEAQQYRESLKLYNKK